MLIKNLVCKLTIYCLILNSFRVLECRESMSASFFKEYDQEEVQESPDSERVIPTNKESSNDEESSSFDFDSDSDSDDSGYAADNDGLQFAFDDDLATEKKKEKLVPCSEEELIMESQEQSQSDTIFFDPE